MFRIEFFCDDRRVGDALRNLMGIAIGSPTAQPVINAEKTNGKIKAQSGGKLIEMFAHHIANIKDDTFTPKDAQAWLKKLGKSPLSASYILKGVLAQGLVKRTGKSSQSIYHVIKALPKPKKGGAHG